MIRFKQALKSARSRIFNLLPTSKTRADSYTQAPQPVPFAYSAVSPQQAALALSEASAHSPSPSSQRARALPPGSWKVPATLSISRHEAQVCKFSHGSGLIVYINGALMTAARVALQVNIATLGFVKKLPLDELEVIGGCLAAAFSDGHEPVDISYCEVDDWEEEVWRCAEREWEAFPGGPYEYHKIPCLCCSLRQMQDHGTGHEDAILSAPRRRLRTRLGGCDCAETPSSQCSSTGCSSTSGACSEEAPALMTDAQFEALPDYDDSFSYVSLEGQDAMEQCAIDRPVTWRESLSELSSGTVHAARWSPGRGDGPIMSSAQFDALPNWSDVEDELDWNSGSSDVSQACEVDTVAQGDMW
ncbi:hypothetical protein EKO04_009056 [Ascochyta lentis]|uniref:Uncharacterized protein n=1 Tax=Ascochyta lentis TaxID=205686 RepID=A0A8H7IX82_9PLEO|nr:hypothetical protein EKO04_009056 [Ascochyta lentis]